MNNTEKSALAEMLGVSEEEAKRQAYEAIDEALERDRNCMEFEKNWLGKRLDVFDEYGNYKYPSDVELTEPNTATSMPCEDEYIKIPKKALKYRTAGMVAYNVEWLNKHFDIERTVICGAQEPCEDAISRDAALEKIADYVASGHADSVEDFEEYSRIICQLPPVTPQPKTGHWIEHPEIETSTPEYLMFYECSECGNKQCFCKSDIHKKRFCGNCGCRMVEPQERSGEE